MHDQSLDTMTADELYELARAREQEQAQASLQAIRNERASTKKAHRAEMRDIKKRHRRELRDLERSHASDLESIEKRLSDLEAVLSARAPKAPRSHRKNRSGSAGSAEILGVMAAGRDYSAADIETLLKEQGMEPPPQTSAVVSYLSSRGKVERVRRGVYRLI
ncbi:hypothetical protein TK90_2789 (plasmid) [Thioalkalivibrio sp. K90mix]|uniref:type IV toxin-antitoxin system AbiEi family antitoxin domain-containing protein n=1 Tax=Thioalkalivibrio sp. (strain K90mix) TaxID=396595 RepID=UPI000195A697|nr:type IV toxin-antitoxin system AbiEi family antitoxin domain-containing protein [Thioalkalivibrio sp. K90mix]ADC73274.1 hypothetical protein TK90_2789 [Thioalkalivibrio sp. K90mix]